MADSPRERYSPSPPPRMRESRSRSRSIPRLRERSRSRSRSIPRPRERSTSPVRGRSHNRTAEDLNPGNALYVTGLSTRVTERELEEHFAKEGKVASCFLVVEPRTRISRGFAFITMDSLEDANRCVKYLNQSVLEGRYITVEKSRRKRARTPTPGHYLGLKSNNRDFGRGDRGGRYRGNDDQYRSPPRRSPPYRGGRDYSPRRSPPYRGGRQYSPPRHSPPPYGGRSRRERSRSLPRSPYRSPERRYYPRASR